MGLAVGGRLADEGYDVLILEKEGDFGLHASGRNSGVLHAGIYYAPDSLKARFAIEGNRRMREFVKERGIPINESGKVIVARDEDEDRRLEELYERARKNGAEVHLIDGKELKEIEPNARTFERAIFSPNTAVVNPKDVIKALVETLKSKRNVRLMTGVRCLKRYAKGKVLTTEGVFEYGVLVNAAGLHADTLARSYGVGKDYLILPFKGTYKELRPSHLVRGNVYPVPHPKTPFLGVHFTRSPEGRVFVGPTAFPVLSREAYSGLGVGRETHKILWRLGNVFLRNRGFREAVFSEIWKYSGSRFYARCSEMVEGIGKGDIIPSDRVGIRAQLVDVRRWSLVMDFVVLGGERSVHILNAVSPAFTSAFPFADYVVNGFITGLE